MIKGLYRAASGMLPRTTNQEVISNNLANANTVGYKRQSLFIEELTRAEQRVAPSQENWETPMLSDIYTDYSQAVLEPTGNDLNLALDGSGFMIVESPDGEQFYTRAGDFTISTDGDIVTTDGYTLMTDAGPINLQAGSKLEVGMDGAVSVDGQQIGMLELIDFEKPYNLERISGSLFKASDNAVAVETQNLFVRQGFVERANVDVISEMVEMIASFRDYEANQKAIQIIDESVDRTVNDVGSKR